MKVILEKVEIVKSISIVIDRDEHPGFIDMLYCSYRGLECASHRIMLREIIEKCSGDSKEQTDDRLDRLQESLEKKKGKL